jgi:hypothetical protein
LVSVYNFLERIFIYLNIHETESVYKMSYFDSENEYDPWAPVNSAPAYSFGTQPAAPQPSFAGPQPDLPAPQPAFAPQAEAPLQAPQQGFPTQQPAFQAPQPAFAAPQPYSAAPQAAFAGPQTIQEKGSKIVNAYFLLFCISIFIQDFEP